MPNIENDGSINGSKLLINHKKSDYGIWKITQNMDLVNKYN